MVAVTATIAVGSVMQVIVGIPRTPAILISSAVMVAYSVLGGMWSLTLTDIIQFIIKTVGIFFILLPGAIMRAGGLERDAGAAAGAVLLARRTSAPARSSRTSCCIYSASSSARTSGSAYSPRAA